MVKKYYKRSRISGSTAQVLNHLLILIKSLKQDSVEELYQEFIERFLTEYEARQEVKIQVEYIDTFEKYDLTSNTFPNL